MEKKSKISFLDQLIRIIAILLAVALFIGSLAGKVDPRANQYIPFFGLAYPFLLCLNIFMVIWWLLRKRWKLAIFMLILMLSGWQTFRASYGFSGTEGEGPKSNEKAIRMMTYNVHSFKPYGEEIIETVKEQMLSLIKTENPDIICFQEYFTRYKGPYDITDSLKRMLKTPYYYFVPVSKNDYEANGLAIFSKYPILGKGQINFKDNYNGNSSIYADVQIGNKLVRVYNVHLQSIAFDKQDYNYLDKITKKMDAEITPSRRILGMLKTAFRKRSDQVDIMKAQMKECQLPFIIAGDFNDTPASYAVTQLTSALKNTFIQQGSGFGRTYNGKFPNFQIDYISTTSHFNVLNYRVVEAKLSDHFPVRSDLILNP
ncbi:endonuclease/exonuclease/phosphatase family metal-dependent hydrolase [Pedobacter sp. UYP24]